MATDLIRPTERAAITTLKGFAPLVAIVPKHSIDPMPKTAGIDVDGAPVWPFIRIDGSQAALRGRRCSARSDITLQVHSFARMRKNSAGAEIEKARDHCGRINSAVVEALHQHAFTIDGRRYRFIVRSSRLLVDGAEVDAWHGVASLLARAFTG